MILYNAGKPRLVGGELQSEYKNHPQDKKMNILKIDLMALKTGKHNGGYISG